METIREKNGFSGSTLKLLAILAMLVDHIGVGVLYRYMEMPQVLQSSQYGQLEIIYTLMRGIGRIAFPIFAFLLAEGFEHTQNRKKYALRLLAFCVISEVPFDLLFEGEFLEFSYQNVFFTLFFAFLVMWAFSWIEEHCKGEYWKNTIFKIAALAAGAGMAELLKTDYGALGVLCIMILYIFRSDRKKQAILGALSFYWEWPAMFAFLPIWFYNGKRGLSLKYFFYLFYPVHLLILYGVVCFLKLPLPM